MAAPDAVRMVEAGYSAAHDERSWLQGIVEAAAGFGVSTGVAAFTVDLGAKQRITSVVGSGVRDDFETELRAFDGAIDDATAKSFYEPTEFAGNAEYRVRRLAADQGRVTEDLTNGKRLRAWGLMAGDARSHALGIAFPGDAHAFDPEQPFPHARVLGLVGAHLGAALRLRELGVSTADDPATECILSPEGRVLHATGDARTHRRSLVDAVERRARARGKLRQVDASEAANLWAALVAGRWTIVDFSDCDGKRMLLARKNPLDAPDILSLTEEERDVCWLVTLGHSQKYVAYELGLSMSGVARRLASGLSKLRLSSRRDLLRKLGR